MTVRGRLALALTAAVAVVATGPLIGLARAALRRWLPDDYELAVNAIVVLAAAAGGIVCLLRIRERRGARYLALGAAMAFAAVSAWVTRTGDPTVDAVERFHFVEYAALTLLFYLAWRDRGDASALLLPAAATFVTGVADETFQWFVPARVGEWRDVVINLLAIASGLLFSVAIVPMARFTGRVTERRVAALAVASAALAVAGFLHLVHAGVVVHDVEVGPFTSRFDADELQALYRDRFERWRTTPPPMTLQRYSREDQYRTEAVERIGRRNNCVPFDLRLAWKENVILERYYGPVLDTPGYDVREVSRWPPEQRSDYSRQLPKAPRRPCPAEAVGPVLFLWSPLWLWAGAAAVTGAALGWARRAPATTGRPAAGG
jgi:VanZ family protein